MYIENFELYTRYSEDADKKKVLGGDCFFKLPKGGDLKKEFGKPCFRGIELQFKQVLFTRVFKT